MGVNMKCENWHSDPPGGLKDSHLDSFVNYTLWNPHMIDPVYMWFHQADMCVFWSAFHHYMICYMMTIVTKNSNLVLQLLSKHKQLSFSISYYQSI